MTTPPPPRYAAARVEVTWRIVPAAAPGQYVLYDDKGAMVRTGPKPRALSDYAFDNGATSVRWDFDLGLIRS